MRGALHPADTFVGGLDRSEARDRACASTGSTGSAPRSPARTRTIATALDELGPGLKVLADERAQFTVLADRPVAVRQVASRVIRASSSQTIAELHDLQPVLHHLAAAGANLPRSLEILITFPFPRDLARRAPGDYINFGPEVDLGPSLCALFAGQTPAQLAAHARAGRRQQLGPAAVGWHRGLPRRPARVDQPGQHAAPGARTIPAGELATSPGLLTRHRRSPVIRRVVKIQLVVFLVLT